jgi:beta-lactamase class A
MSMEGAYTGTAITGCEGDLTLKGTVLLVAASLSAAARPSAAEDSLERLRSAVSAVVADAEGEVGVAIEHLESGHSIDVNGSTRFPMASTFKIAILVELFQQVDDGKIRLDEMVSLESGDIHIGSGELNEFLVPGIALSIENLARLMMRVSDNSATDLLMEKVGVENINRRLAALGVDGISVDRTCQRLILDWLGISPSKTSGMSYQEIQDFLNAYQPAPGELDGAASEFEKDPRDTATPLAMNRLLRSIFRGEAASEPSCRRMTEILLECETGKNRIKGLLPGNVQVAHKTGTLGGTVNNVGILYLPEGRGHVAVSVLSKGMKDRDKAERAIAEIARYAYDYFLFLAP